VEEKQGRGVVWEGGRTRGKGRGDKRRKEGRLGKDEGKWGGCGGEP